MSQPETPSRSPDIAKNHALCFANATRNGALLVIAATVAPSPNVTSRIGSAQQISVAVDETSVIHVAPVP